jgi:hypothetical protein
MIAQISEEKEIPPKFLDTPPTEIKILHYCGA